MREVNIKYHSIPGDRLPQQTRLDLVSAGVPECALGTLSGRVLTLSACVVLTPAARGSLPPVLGGTFESFPASPATAHLVSLA